MLQRFGSTGGSSGKESKLKGTLLEKYLQLINLPKGVEERKKLIKNEKGKLVLVIDADNGPKFGYLNYTSEILQIDEGVGAYLLYPRKRILQMDEKILNDLLSERRDWGLLGLFKIRNLQELWEINPK